MIFYVNQNYKIKVTLFQIKRQRNGMPRDTLIGCQELSGEGYKSTRGLFKIYLVYAWFTILSWRVWELLAFSSWWIRRKPIHFPDGFATEFSAGQICDKSISYLFENKVVTIYLHN